MRYMRIGVGVLILGAVYFSPRAYGTNWNEIFRNLLVQGVLFVGTGTPGVTQTQGSIYASGTLEVDGATTLDGSIAQAGKNTVASGGEIEIQSGATLDMQSGAIITSAANVTHSGTHAFTAAVAMDSTLGVTGTTTLEGALDANGATDFNAAVTLQSTIGVTGTTTLEGALDSNGAADFAGAVTMQTTLGVTGTTTLEGDLEVNSANNQIQILWLANDLTKTISGLTLPDANFIVLLEPTTGVTGAGVGTKATTGFVVTLSEAIPADVTQRALAIPY